MSRPAHITAVTAEAAQAALRDHDMVLLAGALADGPTALFVRQLVVANPPLQHLVPVLALARAAAALALLFGDPALIDLFAVEARRAMRDGSVTIHDIFGSSP